MPLDQVRLGTPPSGSDGDDPRTAFTRINSNFKLLDDSGVTGPVIATRELSNYNNANQPGKWLGTAAASNRPPGFGRSRVEVDVAYDGTIIQEVVDITSGQLACRSYSPSTSTWGNWLVGGFSGVLSVSRGGTGGANQADARTGLGLKSAAVADVLGTVSQASGVPTGAIIERGSNANGDYTKFADGTLICRITGSNSQSVPNNSGVEITVTYPATFVGAPTPSGNAGLSTSGTTGLAARIAVGFPFTASSASSARMHIYNTTGITIGGFSYFLTITGRWF